MLALPLAAAAAPLHAGGDSLFTAVILSDPHIEQTGHDGASVATMQGYVRRIIALGQEGGKRYQFAAAPAYVPKADIVFCLGDMDQDNEHTGDNFRAAFQGLNDAGIPFITMLGNHDIVPDYWTGYAPDYGLTWGGVSTNEVSMQIVDEQLERAQRLGVTDLERITDGTTHTQARPFTFVFRGVRFYCGQAYWFQKPYSGFFINGSDDLSTGHYYAPDGVIRALDSVATAHSGDASVWMQHYPFLYGSDCDRWWLDQTDVGKYIKTDDASEFGTDKDLPIWTGATATAYAKKKKDRLAAIIARTRNAVHFSGHVHSYGEETYGGIVDHTVAAPAITSGGMFLVLMKEGEGVVEIKKIDLDGAALAGADSAVAESHVPDGFAPSPGDDVSFLLGDNLDFEAAEGDAPSGAANIHAQPGWHAVWAVDATTYGTGNVTLERKRGNSGAATLMHVHLSAKQMKNDVNDYIYKEVWMPAGVYTLRYFISNAQSEGVTENLCCYELGGQRTPLPTTRRWSQQTVTITVGEPQAMRLCFGFRGGTGSKGAEMRVDDLSLTYDGTTDAIGAIPAATSGASDAASAASSATYTLDGRRVATPAAPGIYIRDGKKHALGR